MNEPENESQASAPSDTTREDPVWDAAWAWVRRQSSPDAVFDATAQRELVAWLAADAAHRQAYDKAGRLWLLVGLVPPKNDIPFPDDDDSAAQ